MIRAFIDAWKNIFNVQGRTRRMAYWWFCLDTLIIDAIFGGLTAATGGFLGFLLAIVSIALTVVGFTITIRRLHDIGRSAWFLLWFLLPVIGQIVLVFALIRRGDSGDNEYGPNPLSLRRLTANPGDGEETENPVD